MEGLPHFADGEVIKGFGRGSKELGIPTANYPIEVINNLPANLPLGIYSGFARINHGPIYKMVMSVGLNPFYKNEKKSMETHVMHTFEEDFYGKHLQVVMVNYLRPERNFSSLDELISAIKADIGEAERTLDDSVLDKHKHFFDLNTSCECKK